MVQCTEGRNILPLPCISVLLASITKKFDVRMLRVTVNLWCITVLQYQTPKGLVLIVAHEDVR